MITCDPSNYTMYHHILLVIYKTKKDTILDNCIFQHSFSYFFVTYVVSTHWNVCRQNIYSLNQSFYTINPLNLLYDFSDIGMRK